MTIPLHTVARTLLRMLRCLPSLACWLAAAIALAGEPSALAAAAEKETSATVEILRDPWGVPHIFAATDAGAFHGLGYATAEDRAFQMTYSLRIIQGRLAETVGVVKMMNRNETSVDNDRKMRTFGFYRAAQRTAANLDPETRALLQAYCDGVNDYFAQHREDLHPLFARLGVKPEPWTAADCLASWWHLGQFFATDGTRELIVGRNATDTGQGRAARGQARPQLPGRDPNRPALPADVKPMPADDGPAVVKRSDVTTNWIERVERYAREHGLQAADEGAEGPKFSHAWVVGGKRTTTGSSVLVSDPQTAVRNPSLFYEFHLQGKSFNARGIGVAGSPIILIGFTEQVAWGVTALGADQADLFLLETDLARAYQYRFDGQWRPMTVHRETILVKGGNPIEWIVRETHLGPVATAFCFTQPGDGEVALKRIPICETNRETIQGAIAMMRARNANEFHTALNGWQFPSVNLLFGDREGNIGYRAAAAIPIRSRVDETSGHVAKPGRAAEHDWQEILPGDLLPQVSNPKAGFLYSGNHRPIESWYPLPLGAMTGAGGDTIRSWRLRERLETKSKFSPEEVRDIHYDTVNPARREIVRVALHLRDGLKRELSDDARQALAHLEPWYRAGASSSLTSKGAELATELNTFFRFMNTDLALVYGGGESGLAYFLKTAAARLERDPKADFSPVEQSYLDQVLAGAWQSARQKYGEDSSAWNSRARQGVRQRRLGYFESLDGFPALDPAQDLSLPALTDMDGGTIASQASQSYTQWVPMHDPDQAQSILPIGQSERPGSPSRTSTTELWSEGKLHPAPLSRAEVEQLGVSKKTVAARTKANAETVATLPSMPPEAGSKAALLEPPAGRVVHGMGQWEAFNAKLLPACQPQCVPPPNWSSCKSATRHAAGGPKVSLPVSRLWVAMASCRSSTLACAAINPPRPNWISGPTSSSALMTRWLRPRASMADSRIWLKPFARSASRCWCGSAASSMAGGTATIPTPTRRRSARLSGCSARLVSPTLPSSGAMNLPHQATSTSKIPRASGSGFRATTWWTGSRLTGSTRKTSPGRWSVAGKAASRRRTGVPASSSNSRWRIASQ
jgi:penicillin amidase